MYGNIASPVESKTCVLFCFECCGIRCSEMWPRYYGPFFLLFFRARGLTFAQYGLLVAYSEVLMNLWEVPSGAIADSAGRRRTLAFSFLLYISAFAGYSAATSFAGFLLAFFCFAGGEAFRAGTHKALIFEWCAGSTPSPARNTVHQVTCLLSRFAAFS